MCKRPRENPAGSCQCSVDPVLSSHDEPYFEMYLSSRAFFTFVTTSASMEVCFREWSLSIRETRAEGNELGYETIASAITGV